MTQGMLAHFIALWMNRREAKPMEARVSNGLPAEWALTKAKQLSGLPANADSIPQAVMAFARYIEEHEEAPIASGEHEVKR